MSIIRLEPSRPTVLCDHVAAARGSSGNVKLPGLGHALMSITYNGGVQDLRFEWDERKNTQNRRKHGVSFEEAETGCFSTIGHSSRMIQTSQVARNGLCCWG